MPKEKTSPKLKTAEIWTDGRTYNVEFDPPISYKRLMQLDATGLVRDHVEDYSGNNGRRFAQIELNHEHLPAREKHDFILFTLKHNPGTLRYVMPEEIEYRPPQIEDL